VTFNKDFKNARTYPFYIKNFKVNEDIFDIYRKKMLHNKKNHVKYIKYFCMRYILFERCQET